MIYISIRFIKYLYYSSRFFFASSKSYIDKWTISAIGYYPIAYCKFMYLMMQEYKPFITGVESYNETTETYPANVIRDGETNE